jgi:hypothetical protein
MPVFLLGQTVNQAKIVQIKAKRDVVLSYQGKPIPPRMPIWQQEYGPGPNAGSMYPAAFLVGQKHPAALEVTVHIPGLKPGAVYSLQGLFPGKIPIFSGKPVKARDETQEIVFEVFAQYEPEGFFKISGENITWQVTGQDTPGVSQLPKVPLELYWLYGDTYLFLQKGIPVERLREIALACGMTGNIHPRQLDAQQKKIKIQRDDPQKPARKWVIARVVKHCFHRNPPRYNIWYGNLGFTLYAQGERITFLASSYLNALNDPGALFCCWDTAVILQYYLHVIGINDVSLCRMNPFGYLKSTPLVGRGECNNPFFGRTGDEKVVNEKNPQRTAFGNHMFCRLNVDQTIVDSCAGPHLGDQSPEQYVKAAVDETFPIPPLVDPGTIYGITYFSAITHVDFIMDIETIDDEDVFISSFKNILETKDSKNPGPKKFVVRSWPDPRKNPLLHQQGWKLFFEQLLPGIGGAMKIWKLRKDKSAESIDIYLYVSSVSSKSAQKLFFSKCNSHSHHENPFKKGRENLGDYSAMHLDTPEKKTHNKIFWVNNNVVFDLIIRNMTVDLEKDLTEWFDGLAEENLKNSLEKDLPRTDGITCSNLKPRVGEIITVKIEPHTNIIYDFTLDGDGLKLLEITNEAYIFKAMKTCLNTLTMVLVDKYTLLSASKNFYISVQH